MNDRRFPALVDLPDAVRQLLADVPVNYRQWRADLKADHGLFWRTTLVRVGLWAALGLALLFGLRTLIGFVIPSGAGTMFVEPTPLATLYVACTDVNCRHSYTSRQAMDFNEWPLTCEKCGRKTVYRAKLCRTCDHWYATAPGQPDACPFCAARAAAKQPIDDGPKKPTNADDDEDDW